MASRPPNIAGFRPSIASVADFRKCLIIVCPHTKGFGVFGRPRTGSGAMPEYRIYLIGS